MNPPTIGHQVLVDAVIKKARAENADPMIFLSHTQDAKSNPLDYKTKINVAIKAFGNVVQRSAGLNTIEKVLIALGKNRKYDEVILMVGSDRVQSFKNLEKYTGKFKLNSLIVTAEGLTRDPDADDASGMSASKARALAFDGEREEFDGAMPRGLKSSDISKIYHQIRRVIGKKRKSYKKKASAPVAGKAMPSKLKRKELSKSEKEKLYKGGLFDSVENDGEITISERVVSFKRRREMSRLMKRLAPRMKRRREVMKKRMANKDRLEKRAKKQAKQMIRDRFAGDRGKNYSSLGRQQKIAVDKQIEKKSGMIGRFAKRLLPKVRKSEMERLKQARQGPKTQKEETLNESFMPGIAPTIFARDLPELKVAPEFKMHPSIEVEEEALEVGTDKLRKHYEEGTPGQAKLDVIKKILDL